MGNDASTNKKGSTNKIEASNHVKTSLAALNPTSKQIIKIPIDIITNNHTSNRYHCKFDVYALYNKTEIMDNILNTIIDHINKKYSPVNFRIFKITGKNSFIPFNLFFDTGMHRIINHKITNYNKNKIEKTGLQLEIMVNFQYSKSDDAKKCPYIDKADDVLKCSIYYAIKVKNEYTQEYLNHLIKFNHLKQESCKYHTNCPSFKNLENGMNDIKDSCHMYLYKHPPRSNRIQKLSSNVNSLIVNKKNKHNHKIYEPTLFDKEKYKFNAQDGFLYALIEEVKLNGFENDLKYIRLDEIDNKLHCDKHKLLGSPLNRGQMLSLILYCGYQCNFDLCMSQRNGNYNKWKWFDYLLYKSIFTLSSCQTGNFAVYSGLNNVKLNTKEIELGYFVTYVSTSWKKDVAKSFINFSDVNNNDYENKMNDDDDDENKVDIINDNIKSNGMIIKIDESYKNIYRVKCCDVSWISKFPNECEILFARHEQNYKHNSGFKCVVVDSCNGIQNVLLTKK